MDYEYRVLKDGTIELKNFLGENRLGIIVPDEIDGKTVTSIGQGCFYRQTNTKKFVLPNTIKHIGEHAFDYCHDIKSFFIPSSVEKIEFPTFCFCDSLYNLEVSKNNKTLDSRDNCNAIIETKTNKLIGGCHGSCIPNGVVEIDDFALQWCEGIKELVIPDSVEIIGTYAFAFCTGLKKITISSKIKSIGSGPFWGCDNLETIEFKDLSHLKNIRNLALERIDALKTIITGENVPRRVSRQILLSGILQNKNNFIEDKYLKTMTQNDMEYLLRLARNRENVLIINKLITHYNKKFGHRDNLSL